MPCFRIGPTVALVCLGACLATPASAAAEEALAGKVRESIEKAKRFLVSRQNNDGSWSAGEGAQYRVGVTSLATLALINSGMTMDDDSVRRGVGSLTPRKYPTPRRTESSSIVMPELISASVARLVTPTRY